MTHLMMVVNIRKRNEMSFEVVKWKARGKINFNFLDFKWQTIYEAQVSINFNFFSFSLTSQKDLQK